MIINSETGKRILKNAVYLAFGSVIGKAAMFIVFILVARFFGPESFGIYNTAFNHVLILGLFSKLGFDMAIIREGAKRLNDVPDIQNKIFPLRFWLSILIWLITIISAFLMRYDYVTLKLIIIMSPIVFTGGAIDSGLIEHFTSYFRIVEKMQYATYVLLFRTILFSTIIFGFLFLNILSLYNLGFIIVLSSLAALFFQIKQAKHFYKQKFSLKIDFKYLTPFIEPIILFGIVSILYQVSLRLNITMLNKLSNNSETGFFSAAWNLVSIGTLFIASFAGSVFPNSARSIVQKQFRNKLFKGLFIGTLLFCLGGLLTIYFSEYIVTTLYGDTYSPSAKILSIIIWFLPFRLLSLWGHQILESANYLYLRILIFLIPTGINIAINVALIPEYGALGSAYAAFISNLVLLILALVAGLVITKMDKRFLVIQE